ncbi:MAG: hypothetical protein QOF45_1004 [Gaiellaceae bacterium]|nr:hypothetical protein [Gaiellaceae bacterium]
MSEPPAKEPGFDTDLDLAQPDTLDEAEAARLLDWYAKSHGDGSIALTPFVPFLIKHRPGALKRYRAYPQAIHETSGLPQAAIALIWLHHYMVIANANGVAYQVIAAREWGASKDEVLDVVQLTFLEAGPLGVSAVAEKAAAYLDAWPAAEARRVENPWPAGWEPAPADATTSRGRDVPRYVSFLGEHAPSILKALLGRYEQALRDSSIPAPLIPLLHLHTAAIRGDLAGARSAAKDVRAAGVSAAQAVGTLAFAFLYMTEASIERVIVEVEDLFVDWA